MSIQQISPSNTYIRRSDGEYGNKNVPVENCNWTGKWRVDGEDGRYKLYLQRRLMLFGIIPTFAVWESESRFLVRNYECYMNDCIDDPLEALL